MNLLPSAVAAIGFAPETTSRSTVMLPIFFPAVLIISAPSAARQDSTLLGTSPPFRISTSFSSASDQDVSSYPLYANPGELGAYLVESSAYGPWQIIAANSRQHSASAIMVLERVTCGLVLVVEVEEDTAKLGVFAEVGDRCVAAGNEDPGKGLELLVRDGAEWARVADVVLDLHSLDKLLVLALRPPVPEVDEE